MDFEEIKKPDQNQFTVKSNIENYDNSYNNSSWDEIYSELDWLPGGGLNKAYECDVVTLIDEAYYEFCNMTALPLVKKYKNLIIARTFSKANRLPSNTSCPNLNHRRRSRSRCGVSGNGMRLSRNGRDIVGGETCTNLSTKTPRL